MEPSEAAREGACDSYPFPEPTRPPASGKELQELLEGSYDRPWDRCSDRLKEEYNNRARVAMERYEADLDRWRRERTKRYYQNKIGAETLSKSTCP